MFIYSQSLRGMDFPFTTPTFSIAVLHLREAVANVIYLVLQPHFKPLAHLSLGFSISRGVNRTQKSDCLTNHELQIFQSLCGSWNSICRKKGQSVNFNFFFFFFFFLFLFWFQAFLFRSREGILTSNLLNKLGTSL